MSKQLASYVIVYAADVDTLAALVQEHIKKGYRPSGGITFVPTDKLAMLMQPMIHSDWTTERIADHMSDTLDTLDSFGHFGLPTRPM